MSKHFLPDMIVFLRCVHGSTLTPTPAPEIRDEDRKISFNIPKEAPFYLSNFMINRNVHFNMHK